MRQHLILFSLFLSALVIAPWVPAQGSYPSKPVRLIVPYPPGGSTDFVAREVAHRLSEAWGQQVVIDNRAGAGTLIGLNLGAKAAPDGYTVQFATAAGLALLPALGVKMPFDPVKDFVPIGQMVRIPFVLVVHPSVPANSVKELIALAKAQPGKLNYGSPGVGTPNHLGGELLKALAGIDIVHVPYKGSGPAVTDVVAGQLQLMFTGIPQISGFVKSGRLKLIAIATPTRSRVMPDAPAIAETLPGFDCSTWYGLLAPAGTPAAIVTKINADMNKVLAQPEVIQRFLDQGVEVASGTPQELQQVMAAELKRWSTVIKDAGITVDAPR
jgi:tripartite-type tricarboxylate transporter receptor subunit TctC